VILAVLCNAAAVDTHAIKIKAHVQSNYYNICADLLAKTGTEMELHQPHCEIISQTDWEEAIMFVRTWGVNADETWEHKIEKPVQHYATRDPRWQPKINFRMGAKPAKEEAVRLAMAPTVRKSCMALEAALTELQRIDDPHIPDARGDMLRGTIQQIVNEFDQTLWECTVSVFGLRRAEADPKAANNTAKSHTQEFNRRVAMLSDMMTAVQQVHEELNAVARMQLPENISFQGWVEGDWRAYRSADGHTFDVEDEVTLCDKVAWMAGIMVCEPAGTLSGIIEQLVVARRWACDTFEELSEDKVAKEKSVPAALWRFRKIKLYFRHLRKRATNKEVPFNVPPIDYLNFLVGKKLPESFPKRTHEPLASYAARHGIDQGIREEFEREVTVAEVLKFLTKMREASAMSPLSQTGYKMLQMLLPQVHRDAIAM
jgi:hypothetical protein